MSINIYRFNPVSNVKGFNVNVPKNPKDDSKLGVLSDDGSEMFELNLPTITSLLQADNPLEIVTRANTIARHELSKIELLPPIDPDCRASVWAVYAIKDEERRSPRPGLFFKSFPYMVKGPNESLSIRSDSTETIPEVELGLVATPKGIVGFTVGNDMSAKDIIKEHKPGSFTQGKVWDGSCSLGPSILIGACEETAREFDATLKVIRGDEEVFAEVRKIANNVDRFDTLTGWLHKDNNLPLAYLLTGSLVPVPGDFKLQDEDVVEVGISGIGTLRNPIKKLS